MAERQDPGNFPCFLTQEWCAWELAAYVFNNQYTCLGEEVKGGKAGLCRGQRREGRSVEGVREGGQVCGGGQWREGGYVEEGGHNHLPKSKLYMQ